MINRENTKAAVKELLNQIALLTEGVEAPPKFENYNYQNVYLTSAELHDKIKWAEEGETVTDINGKEVSPESINDTNLFLFAVGAYAKRVLKGDVSSAVENENQYYNSNC